MFVAYILLCVSIIIFIQAQRKMLNSLKTNFFCLEMP